MHHRKGFLSTVKLWYYSSMDEKRPNLILITGDETYLKERRRDELLKELGAEGSLNFNTFSDENIDLEEIRRLAETVPLFEDFRKLLIVNSGLFKRALAPTEPRGAGDAGRGGPGGTGGYGSGPGAGTARSGGEDYAVQVFSGIPETTVVIFMENEVHADSSLYKLIKKSGAIYRYDSVDSLKGRGKNQARGEVRDWVRQQLEAEHRSIEEGALAGLLELAGYEMQNLSTELEKLICYTLDRPDGYRITRGDVDAVSSVTLTDRVFAMADLKLKGDTAGALVILEELLAMRVPPMKVLSILEKQYERCYAVRDGMDSGLGDAELMSGLELKDWQLRQVRNQVRGTSAAELRERLEECISMDYRVKNGDMADRLALEILVIG